MMRAAVILVVHATFAGVAFSALFQLDVEAPLKALVLLGFGLMIFGVQLLAEVQTSLDRLYMTIRLLFVSSESARLDKDDLEPAVQKLARDISSERSQDEISRLLGKSAINSFVYWGIYAAIVVGVAFFATQVLFDGTAA